MVPECFDHYNFVYSRVASSRNPFGDLPTRKTAELITKATLPSNNLNLAPLVKYQVVPLSTRIPGLVCSVWREEEQLFGPRVYQRTLVQFKSSHVGFPIASTGPDRIMTKR
jgi:hypothetical protein